MDAALELRHARRRPRSAWAGPASTDVDCWLQDKPVTPPEPREFLRVVCLGHHLERLPDELKEPFVDAVCERAGSPLVLDYVRLNIDARKPGSHDA